MVGKVTDLLKTQSPVRRALWGVHSYRTITAGIVFGLGGAQQNSHGCSPLQGSQIFSFPAWKQYIARQKCSFIKHLQQAQKTHLTWKQSCILRYWSTKSRLLANNANKTIQWTRKETQTVLPVSAEYSTFGDSVSYCPKHFYVKER